MTHQSAITYIVNSGLLLVHTEEIQRRTPDDGERDRIVAGEILTEHAIDAGLAENYAEAEEADYSREFLRQLVSESAEWQGQVL